MGHTLGNESVSPKIVNATNHNSKNKNGKLILNSSPPTGGGGEERKPDLGSTGPDGVHIYTYI